MLFTEVISTDWGSVFMTAQDKEYPSFAQQLLLKLVEDWNIKTVPG